jgi:hypothetical protein
MYKSANDYLCAFIRAACRSTTAGIEEDDEGGDVEGLHVGELADAVAVAPFRKPARGVQVRLAGVVVVDLGGEEFEDAPGGLGCRREKRGGLKLGGRGEDDFGSGHGAPFRVL